MAACDKLYHYVACSFLSTNLDIFLVIHADLLLAATVSLKNWWTILRLSLLILNLFKCRELSAIVQRYTFHPASLNFFDPCHFWKHKYGNLCRIEREFSSLCDHYVCLNWEWVLLWEIRWGLAFDFWELLNMNCSCETINAWTRMISINLLPFSKSPSSLLSVYLPRWNPMTLVTADVTRVELFRSSVLFVHLARQRGKTHEAQDGWKRCLYGSVLSGIDSCLIKTSVVDAFNLSTGLNSPRSIYGWTLVLESVFSSALRCLLYISRTQNNVIRVCLLSHYLDRAPTIRSSIFRLPWSSR